MNPSLNRWPPRVRHAPSEPEDEIFLEGPRSRFAEFFTLLRVMRDFSARISHAPFRWSMRDRFRLSPDQARRSALRANQKNGRRHCAARLHRHNRRRPWHHGSGKPRRQGSWRPFCWLHYRAAVRATDKRLSRSLRADALFLRPQNAPG